MKRYFNLLFFALFALVCLGPSHAESKRKFAWYQNKVNQAGIPQMVKKPVIDGNINENEWNGAISFTGFMAPHNGNRQPYIQPEFIQPTVYAGYDKDYFYMAFKAPVPPSETNSSPRVKQMLNKYWKKGLKAEGKKHDDFLDGDDYWMLDIVNGDGKIYKRDKVHYRMMVNPAGTFSDYRTSPKTRGTHRSKAGAEWESKAIVKSSVSEKYWIVEMAIPVASFEESFQPKPGNSWRIYIRRGRGHETYDTSACEWNAAVGWFMDGQAGLFLFSENIPAFHLESLGAVRLKQELTPHCRLVNDTDKNHNVKLRIAAESIDKVLHEEVKNFSIAPGESKNIDFPKYQIKLPEGCSGRVVVDVESDMDLLYHASIQIKPLGRDEYRKIGTIGMWPFEHPFMDDWQIKCANYPYFKSMDVMVDLSAPYLPDKIKFAQTCKVQLYNKDTGKLIREGTLQLNFKSLKGDLKWDNLDLSNGKYQLKGELYGYDGKPVGKTVTHDFVRKVFPWEHNKIGISDKVYPPFKPMVTDKAKKTITLWGKTYEVGDCGLPGKIVSTKEMDIPNLDIFKGASLSLEAGGEKVLFTGASKILEAKPGIVKIEGQGSAGQLDLKVKSTLRYEGWYEVEMEVIPKSPVKIDSLDLNFAYGKYPDVFWLTWDRAKTFISGIPKVKGMIWRNINPAERQKDCYFVPVVAIGNGDASLWWYADSDENWKLDYSKASQTISAGIDGINYQVMLVNHPVELKEPLKFKFAVQVSPAKPFPKNRRALEWGGQKRVHDTGGYGYWGNGIDSITPGSDERYAKLKDGLDKWVADKKTKEGLAADEFVPVVLYNSGELLGQGMEEFETFSGEWCGETPAPVNSEYIDTDVHTTINYRGLQQDWRSQPKRLGPTKADLVQSCVDCRIWYYKKNMNKLGINGYWFDNASVWPGENPSTGRAYLTKDGTLRPGYPTFARHEIFRRLFVLYKEAGKEPFFLLNGHTSFCFSPWRWFLEGPAYIYKHNGTIFDTLERNREYDIISRLVGAEKVKRDPVAIHRGILRLKRFMGGWCPHGDDSVKGTRSIVALSLLHDFGIEGRFNDHEKFKAMLDKLGYFKPELKYLPYWRNAEYIKVKPKSIKCTLYHNPKDKTVLVVLVNPEDKDFNTSILLNLTKLGLGKIEFSDPENLGEVKGEQEKGRLKLKLNVPSKEYRLIYVKNI
jgi:hypothetical protein